MRKSNELPFCLKVVNEMITEIGKAMLLTVIYQK